MADYATLLALLRSAQGEWVSGAALSRNLGVSRTAIWKQMDALRTAGYVFEAQTRRGYRLVSQPDSVAPYEVLAGLQTTRMGRLIEYRESIASTNDLAKELARAGAAEGTLVIADEQTAGKGRLGRQWSTPPAASIAMSLVLRPDLRPHEAPRLTLLAAVVVAEAIRAMTGLPAAIKWPNDIQIGGRKVCGILTEMEADPDRVHFAVSGIGINVNLAPEHFPAELRTAATALQIEAGQPVHRAALIRDILERFETAYNDLLAGRFDVILQKWCAYCATLGQRVRTLPAAGGTTLEGVAEAVDPDGALLIRSADGLLHRVISGEVSLRPA